MIIGKPEHLEFTGTASYVDALDKICGIAEKQLFIFDNNLLNTGFESGSRFELLRGFLLKNSNNRFHLLAHDTRPISLHCPRLMALLHQFGHNMYLRQTPKHMQYLSVPFAVADELHNVRRFHFNDTRGVLSFNDGESSRLLHSRFIEIWEASQPGSYTSTFTL